MADRDIRAEVTASIVAALEKGTMPWRRPWRDSGHATGTPANAVTGRAYNGGNRLILTFAALEAGHPDSRWLTFHQAQILGGNVKRGEHGTAIEFWERRPFWREKGISYEYQGQEVRLGTWPKEDYPKTVALADGRTVDVRSLTAVHEGKRFTWRQAERELSTLIARSHTVFNVAQCDGLGVEVAQPAPASEPDFGRATHIVQGMEADGVRLKHGGNRAFYSPVTDTVTLPGQEQFESHEKYLGTLLHELGHSTGHAKRNAREFAGGFGSQDYAKEELVAEITSAFVSAEIGVGFEDPEHAAYIGSWLEVLGKDKHALFRAAKHASHAADYLIARGRELEVERAPSKGREQEKANVEEALQGAERVEAALVGVDPEQALRDSWNRAGVSKERQDALIAEVTAKAAPGAQVGPFRVPERRRRHQPSLER